MVLVVFVVVVKKLIWFYVGGEMEVVVRMLLVLMFW